MVETISCIDYTFCVIKIFQELDQRIIEVRSEIEGRLDGTK